ncbi:CubicO group peptidase (beta-lactamase class C family) [Sphingopyxis panaciterrae]|uniref:serine hydrolase domain-containing protein n=1 Tax=Sphingopyxis panaciterrae TaxID=363841 RepID=UPI0014227D8D|nr:serine hydrolase domain-containing protein [Sphingopyxis panaciterrae]NIJ35902.1 CubicO group peptidase (beta-lactamase class C family) [Sphingopyxis panaciterrae]
MRFFRFCKMVGAAALAMLAAPAVSGPVSQAPAAKVAAPPLAWPLVKADVDAWLDGFMPYALERGRAAGAVVVVVKDGAILTQRGFGFADVAKRRPVDPETTLFKQASVSKTITWTAVMQMVEAGKIDLDKDINAYLDFKIPPFDGKPVTMRNLMTHTGGFDEVQRGLNSYDIKDIPSLGTAVKRQVPPRIYAPGTTPAYSNYGTTLAAYIVERVSGMPFNDYAEQRIFAPAGMTHSTFRQQLPARLEPLLANGYLLGSGKPGKPELNSFAPAGGLAASGADLGRFMIAHLDNGGVLLKPETAHLMHDSITKMITPLNGMALGFYEQNINGRKVLSHAGDSIVFHSQLWMFPGEKVGVYMSMNAAGAEKLSAAIRSHLFEAFADRYFPAVQADGRVDAAIARDHARMMVGTYNKTRRIETSFLKAMELTGQYKIALDADGGILFKAAPTIGGANRKWVEIAPFVWREAGGKMRLAAEVKDGRVVRFGIDSSSPFMLFDPVPWYSSAAWLSPALFASLAALTLTALFWPVTALVRHHYGVRPQRSVAEWRAYRLTCLLGALAVIVLVAWLLFASALLSDFSSMNGELDPALIVLRIATPLILGGLVVSAMWNLALVWKGAPGKFARLWSVVLLASAAVLLWIATVFHLIGIGTAF